MPRIMCHHYTINDSDREFIYEKANRMKKFYGKVHEVSVILDAAKNQCIAEILIFGAHVNLRVEHSAPDMRTAFEGAINKAERSLRKYKEKKIGKKLNRRRNVTIRRFEEAQDEQELSDDISAGNNVHLRQELEAKPMSLGEARLQIESLDRDLMVFLNSETEEINVLHRTSDKQVQLLEVGDELYDQSIPVEVHP